MKPRNRKRLTMLVAIILSPLSLVTLLIGINMINPMSLMFITTFEIENKTGEEILVTPIGAVGPKDHRETLPYSALPWPYIMIRDYEDYPIAPGEVRKFHYDWDDIQFSEILIRLPSKEYHVIQTGLHPTKGLYRRPDKDRFEIEDIESTPLAEDKHLEALQTDSNRIFLLYVLAILGFVPPALFFWALKIKVEKEQRE
jgi:hypothetical protein